MDKTTSLLPEMHQVHQKLETVRGKLERGPRQIAAQERVLKQKEEERDALKEKLTELRKAADGKTLQLKSNEAKIQDLKGKLNAAASNKEYEIISSQIEADEMANSVLEDEILEALDKVDQSQQDIAAAEEAIQEQQAKIKATEQQVNETKEGLEEEASTYEAELAELEKELPGTMMDQYRRLVEAHGAGCLTEVENDACTSCYAIISPQEKVQLNMGKVMLCRSCGRIMYQNKS
ncbi:MAG: phospholipase [Planctomycetaceae bacterium]|nr:phospholipase [Planctomycetaceae bacterium]